MIEGIRLRFLSIVQSKSKTFLAFCFSFLAGVVIASLLGIRIPIVYLVSCIIFLLFFLGLFWSNRGIRFSVAVLLCCSVGALRYIAAFPEVTPQEGQIQLQGYIAAEPDARIDGVRYIIKLVGHVSNVYVKTGLYPSYAYGDHVILHCRLEAPPKYIEDFRYDMYLARFGAFAVCRDPDMRNIGEGAGSPVLRQLLFFKSVISSLVSQLWPEPYASFMAGLLYGYRGGLGDLQDAFIRTGVSHIIAISGYNIAIITTILITAFSYLRVRRKSAFWFVVALIVLFVLFVGASPSVVRAGMMGILVLVARQVGRLSRPANLLAFAAAAMALQNPFVLVWDAGFQLSFLATIGILYLAPRWEEAIEPYWSRRMLFLRDALLQTMSAIVATLPLILYSFGQLSVVALPVNLLILWMIPWAMLAGAVAIVIGFLSLPLGMLVAWVAWLGLSYMIIIVQWFARLPFASVPFHLPLVPMLLAYLFGWYMLFRRSRSVICF